MKLSKLIQIPATLIILLSFVAEAQAQESLENPLSTDSINDLIMALVNVFQIIATPIIVFFIIYSGFLYVTARGNTEQLDKAKRTLIYAIIGGVVIVGSIAVGTIVKNTACEFDENPAACRAR